MKMTIYVNMYSRHGQGAIAIGFTSKEFAERKAKESQKHFDDNNFDDRVVASAIPVEIDYPTN